MRVFSGSAEDANLETYTLEIADAQEYIFGRDAAGFRAAIRRLQDNPALAAALITAPALAHAWGAAGAA